MMLENLPDIWIAADGDGTSFCSQSEPYFGGRLFSWCDPVQRSIVTVSAGHKVRYVAAEVIDCRPKPNPELWVTRTFGGYTLRSVVGGSATTLCEKATLGDIKLEMHTKCRIAWDENGIRLIGEPVAI